MSLQALPCGALFSQGQAGNKPSFKSKLYSALKEINFRKINKAGQRAQGCSFFLSCITAGGSQVVSLLPPLPPWSMLLTAASGILFNPGSYHIKPLLMAPISLRVKVKVLTMAYVIWPCHLSGLISHHFPLAYSVPPTVTSLHFHKHSMCGPTSGPLLQLFPLLGLLFPQIPIWLILSPFSDLCSDDTSVKPSLSTSSEIAPHPPLTLPILHPSIFFYFLGTYYLTYVSLLSRISVLQGQGSLSVWFTTIFPVPGKQQILNSFQ